MYTSLARFGYGLARSLRPSKVKKLLTPALKKATESKMAGTKLAGAEKTLIKGIKGTASTGYKGYRKLYGATLGTSGARKATSAGLGIYGIGSFLTGDDEDDSEY